MKPYLIGVAGPSCAGKGTLAAHLVSRFNASTPDAVGSVAAVLSLDSYYRSLSHLEASERARYNFDTPHAIDSDLLLQQVRQLREGRTVECPVYDFVAHTRARRSIEFAPRPFIVMEGLFALYWEELRALLGTKVYVDLGEELCLERRIERDVRERGRTRESALLQYQTTVAPMARRYVYPARAHADLLVSGDAAGLHEEDSEYARQVEAVLRHVQRGTK